MGIIIGKQQEIDAYFASSSVNQSSLKNLEGGFDNFMAEVAKKKKNEAEGKATPEYFLVGGAVDTILTGEEGEFEKQYYTSNLEKKPSEVEIKIISSVFDELVANDVIEGMEFSDNPDAILAAADEAEWQMRWKTETRVSKLIEAGTDYFEDLKKSLGKKILTTELKNKIDLIVASLRHNPKTKKYFDREMQESMENMDFYYQLPIYFMYEGVYCKALMDLVVVHKDKDGNIIKIEPIDLKTMSGPVLQFNGKIRTHRYDIQSAWYVKALECHFGCSPDIIAPFKFIVESTTNIGKPQVFQITEATLQHGRTGSPRGVFTSDNSDRQLIYPEVKGYEQLMQEYIYYSNQGWEQDRILDDCEEIIEIDYVKGIEVWQ